MERSTESQLCPELMAFDSCVSCWSILQPIRWRRRIIEVLKSWWNEVQHSEMPEWSLTYAKLFVFQGCHVSSQSLLNNWYQGKSDRMMATAHPKILKKLPFGDLCVENPKETVCSVTPPAQLEFIVQPVQPQLRLATSWCPPSRVTLLQQASDIGG